MSEFVVSRFIGEAKTKLVQIAEDSMLYPKSDPFEHGVQVGKYQGLLFALGILEDVLSDNRDMEKNR